MWCTIGLANYSKNIWMKNCFCFPSKHVNSHPNVSRLSFGLDVLTTGFVRASPVGHWMSRSNGNLAILDENRVPVVSACHSPSSAPRHFHSRTRYSVGHCWALDFPQQRWVTTHDGEVSEVTEAVMGEVTKVRVWVFDHPWLHLFVRLEREFCDFL
jgi:hypothetical protein